MDVADFDRADLILVMTRAHERALAVRWNKAPGHVFVLGEFARLVDGAESVAGVEGSKLDRLLRTIASRRPPATSLTAADEIDNPYGGRPIATGG